MRNLTILAATAVLGTAALAGEASKWPASSPVAGDLKVNEWVKV
jgi:hypothetical protein